MLPEFELPDHIHWSSGEIGTDCFDLLICSYGTALLASEEVAIET